MPPIIYTFTHQSLNPLDPQMDQIRIEDIAHALACCNRFAGHVREPISVAQHSVYAAHLCPTDSLQALLHDASEAYLGDVTKWLKATPEFTAYRLAEANLQRKIYSKFGCAIEDSEEVKRADNLLVRFEMNYGFNGSVTVGALNPERDLHYPPLSSEEIESVNRLYRGYTYWGWKEAERRFLETYDYLTRSK